MRVATAMELDVADASPNPLILSSHDEPLERRRHMNHVQCDRSPPSQLGLTTALTGHACGRRAARAASRNPRNIDADQMRTTPVLHRYIHGTIPDDARFQLLLPTNWNGKLMVFTRGFSADKTEHWGSCPPLSQGATLHCE